MSTPRRRTVSTNHRSHTHTHTHTHRSYKADSCTDLPLYHSTVPSPLEDEPDPAPTTDTASSTVCEDSPPSPEAPEFPKSRPWANVPRGHPLAPVKKVAAKKAPAKNKAGGRGRGRPHKNGGAVVEEGEEGEEEEVQALPPPSSPGTPLVIASLTGAAAVAESARLRGEEQCLRRDRTEQLRLSKDLEKKAAEAEAVRARHRNPAGGADLVVVTRPQRSRAPARNPNGSPIMREAETDAALLARLKKGKHKADAPAAPKRKKARR
ncbi:hypothetical protein B0H14DRAFT_3512241 [Mycena olivaceomarginata]|nr:hypothetical protein B0H14DRAFT_3512241 [Mycena olivaceomarginata]